MKILALDTSMTACSVALWRDGGVAAAHNKAMKRGHSEALMVMVRAVLDDAECGFCDLDLLAVTVGPGSFTGIRTGLAAARGMAMASELPCLGVTTLETVAHGLDEGERCGRTVLVALDSKREDVYVQAFDDRLNTLTEARCIAVGGLAEMLPPSPVVMVGDACVRAAESLTTSGFRVSMGTASGVPDAAVLAAIAASRWHPDDKPSMPGPFYLRPPDVSTPRNGAGLRQ